MLVKKSQSKKHENSVECTVREYELPSDEVSFATAHINGRYPKDHKAANTKCEQIYFVISGSGMVHSEKGDFELQEGDLFFFEKGEAYWVDGTNLLVALINAPKWTPEQYKIID